MSEKSVQVLEEALALPAAERAEMIDRLLASLDSTPDRRVEELWGREAEERLEAFERGEFKAMSARDVFDAIKNNRP